MTKSEGIGSYLLHCISFQRLHPLVQLLLDKQKTSLRYFFNRGEDYINNNNFNFDNNNNNNINNNKMANNDILNESMMSSASAISAIGLEQTMTEEFQELKGLQAEVSRQIDNVVDYYQRVKDFVVDEAQNGSGEILMDLENFDEERHAAVEALSEYYAKTALAVRVYIDANSRKRVKKIHRFVNMKVKLLLTKEMADDGLPNTQDQQFLDERDASFPVGMIPAGTLDIPTPQTPGQEATTTIQERKPTAKGYSDVASSYLLRGKGLLMEKFATPAKKDFSPIHDLRLTPQLNANSSKFDPVATSNAVSMIAAISAAANAEVAEKAKKGRPQRASSPIVQDVKRKERKRSEKGKKKSVSHLLCSSYYCFSIVDRCCFYIALMD